MEQQIKCPNCDSTSIIEHVVMENMEKKTIYRCLECGKEFGEEDL
jgi:DNA-directed RNA polymerase subunit RPC12/RpoP